MPVRIHSTLYFLPRWLGFGSIILLLSLPIGCETTSLKRQIPIDTANLLPKELAIQYLQTEWSQIEPTEEGMQLKHLGLFGGRKFYGYEQVGIVCQEAAPYFIVHAHPYSETTPYSHADFLIIDQDRGKLIKLCTALHSLGVHLQDNPWSSNVTKSGKEE